MTKTPRRAQVPRRGYSPSSLRCLDVEELKEWLHDRGLLLPCMSVLHQRRRRQQQPIVNLQPPPLAAQVHAGCATQCARAPPTTDTTLPSAQLRNTPPRARNRYGCGGRSWD
jgi:hypothetical protein